MEQKTMNMSGHVMRETDAQGDKKIRARGAINVVVGGVLGALALAWLMSGDRSSAGAWALIGCAAPFVLAAVGMIEAGSGVPFQRFSEAWAALRSWQRAIVGMMVLVLFVMLLMGAAVLAF